MFFTVGTGLMVCALTYLLQRCISIYDGVYVKENPDTINFLFFKATNNGKMSASNNTRLPALVSESCENVKKKSEKDPALNSCEDQRAHVNV